MADVIPELIARLDAHEDRLSQLETELGLLDKAEASSTAAADARAATSAKLQDTGSVFTSHEAADTGTTPEPQH